MALFHFTLLYITLPWLYFILLSSTVALLHSTVLYCTLLYHGSTSLNFSLHLVYSMVLLYPTLLFHGSTSLYFTLHYSSMALLHSTWFHIMQPWFYFTPLYSTFLYPVSTSLSITVHYSTMALHHLYVALNYSTKTSLYVLYINLQWLYFTLLDPMLLFHGYTSLYFPYITLPWL